ncbi:C4-dicarboxylate ABC transporter [Vibrio sp. MACH09]|uniref:YfcC family protein n=1 Tax=Vibrio sp. MACH09 TaxID=3025122 RepID=UPI00278E8287|nr:AbgT family transporter [Vibrio sp. MACH09]GLO61108.1 C4-dicarboxylate ABC transporter [Vibrio sp. MACH09]
MNTDSIIDNEPTKNETKEFQIPHTFILLLIVGAIVAVLTHFIPAGEFVRIAAPGGRMMVDPSSYQIIESTPVGFMQFMVSIPKGFVEAGWIVALTFCVGGGFAVLRKTGVIEVSVNRVAARFSERGIIIVPILMFTFSMIDTFIGMPELCMVYVPIILPLMLALGYDSITACAIALAGSAAGFTAALTNPFTVAIAQKIAGLPLYSGAMFRAGFLVALVTIGAVYVARYAKKIKNNPEASDMYEEDLKNKEILLSGNTFQTTMTKRQSYAGIAGIMLFFVLIGGVFTQGWDMPEIGAMFILIGVVSGVISGLSGNDICEGFVEGCRDVLVGALIIGVARSITVIMADAQIIDTIVNTLGNMLGGLPEQITALGMLAVQSFMNFLIPSGSAKTLITMPIMAPLADIIGITRQTAILALQIGDGLSNILWPTSGYFMATLAVAKVPWIKWTKFYLPLFLIWTTVGAGALILAYMINWQ